MVRSSGVGDGRWRRWLPLAAAVALLLFWVPTLATAEEPVRIKTLKASVWPEYDEPGVLVMYVGKLSDGAPLPREMKFLVPAGATPNSACSVQPDGNHINETYSLLEEGGETILSFTLTQPEFHVEYYYNPLGDQADRSFTYELRTFESIDAVELDVQQPLKATRFVVDPAGQWTSSDSEGFRYHNYKFANVGGDRPVQFKIAYSKTDPMPSKLRGQENASSGDGSDPRVLYALLGVVVIGGVGYFAFTSRSPKRPAASSRVAARASSRRPAAGNGRRSGARVVPGEAAISPRARATPTYGGFCTGCGTRLEKDDRFCPNCGAKSKRLS